MVDFRPRMETIENAIRLKNYELFDYWYKRRLYDSYKLLRHACDYQNYHVANKLYEYIDETEEMEFIIDTEYMTLEEETESVLMYFAKHNWFRLIRNLKGKLSSEYINLREYQEGKTALSIAVEFGNKLAVKALIDIGADPNLGTYYCDRRWDEKRDEVINSLPTFFEDMNMSEQHLYYSYLERYYEEEIENGEYETRSYIVEISNLCDEFFDVYVRDNIVSDVTPAMFASKMKNLEILEILWEDNETEKRIDSNGCDVLDYAISCCDIHILDFIYKKIASYEHCESEIECSICHSVKSNVKTTCKHLYCKDCLLKWLSIKNNCPMCRKQFYMR